MIDPDAWLSRYDRESFRRTINANGSVRVDHANYYIGKRYAGHRALLILDAENKAFDVWVKHEQVKTIPIKGLFHGEIAFPDYVDRMTTLARSEAKRLRQNRRRSG